MTSKSYPYTRVRLGDLSGRKAGAARIRRDVKAPGRIYMEITPYTSMTEAQAIELANALADVIESRDQPPTSTAGRQSVEDHNTYSSTSRKDSTMQHPQYSPQELKTTLTEFTNLAHVAVDHVRDQQAEPLPEAEFTHPQAAANIATHLAAFFALHAFSDWEALTQWFDDLNTKGLDRMTNNPQALA